MFSDRIPATRPPCYPIVHQNIEEEIPEHNQTTVKKIHYLWLATEALLLWNMVACLAILIAHPATLSNTAADFGVAFVYVSWCLGRQSSVAGRLKQCHTSKRSSR